MNAKYYENENKITKIEYEWVGYGINAESVYKKIITVFTIAEGIVKQEVKLPKFY